MVGAGPGATGPGGRAVTTSLIADVSAPEAKARLFTVRLEAGGI